MTSLGHLMLASEAGTRSASSKSCHLIRNSNSPCIMVAPTINSGTRFWLKPRNNINSLNYF